MPTPRNIVPVYDSAVLISALVAANSFGPVFVNRPHYKKFTQPDRKLGTCDYSSIRLTRLNSNRTVDSAFNIRDLLICFTV